MRVFMCTAGTLGFRGWAISEMPLAQKRGSSSAPGICLRNSGENSPCTVEVWTPTFSKTRPCIIDMMPPPPLPSSRCHGVRSKRPGAQTGQRPLHLVLELLEGGADAVAQFLEPGAGARLLVFDVGRQACRYFGTFHALL